MTNNPIESARQQISELIAAINPALTGVVEVPKDRANGDFSATHAMVSAKKLGKRPRDIAEEIVASLDLGGTYFESVTVAGPGFLNFTLSERWYRDALISVDAGGETFGKPDTRHCERVMVEFVSANPTGPMTIGNARGGALGDTLANVLERAGYDVWREFYVNDAGNQVDLFGKSIDARYMQLVLGADAVEFPENGYHGDDIRDLAREIFDREGDRLTKLAEDERVAYFVEYGLPRNIALMREHLARYKIQFDEWFHESTLHDSGYVAETVALLERNGLTYEKDGALWLNNTSLGADKDEVLRRSNGFYTYYASDIAYHRNKFEVRGFDRVIDVWGADHHGHAIRFRATMTAPCFAISEDRLTFLIMQMVRLTRDGETIKVSKRTGRALTLNDLLDEIPVDAARFFFNAKPDNHLEFDLGLAVRQDSENPVYYVQYAHARICRVIDALAAEGYAVGAIEDIDASLLSSSAERELIRALGTLPDEIAAAARELDPSRVNRYVTELASRFHKFYTECRIRGERDELLSARLKLADLTRGVIANCLAIVGVSAPEKM
ncbi:MAG: arginine--tRNA ligase [Oscillospiraceae bacterium]|jgi:arginyl-tRNA synthetase|nr:arginine--tRNA ligase [Oscillospiraceae bacterium]